MSMSFLLIALACTGEKADDSGDSGDSAAPVDSDPSACASEDGEGTLALSFALEPDYLDQLDGEAVGPFWGAFWRGDEVSGVGPEEGAESLGGIYVEQVDLRPDGGPTGVLLTSGPLPAGEVVVLGFLDVDGNAVPDAEDPDDGDPVTLPFDNYFTVCPGEERPAEVFFGLLNP